MPKPRGQVRCSPGLCAVVLGVLFSAGCATDEAAHRAQPGATARPSWATTLSFERPVHFVAEDGSDIVASAGHYRIEPTDRSHLSLTSPSNPAPLTVAAVPQSHDIDLSGPFALAFVEAERPHLLLLLPDGQALEAVGSFTGVHARDVARMARNRLYTLDAQGGMVRFGDGATGARLPAGATQLPPAYREGMGAGGNSTELDRIKLQTLLSDRAQNVALTANMQAAQTERFHLEYGIDRPGGDYMQRVTASPEACRILCEGEAVCQAFTFVKANGRCFLKRPVPPAVTNPCCISAKRKSTQEELLGNMGR